MSRPKITFDERLETLVLEADNSQLQRMHDLSGFLLRFKERANGTEPPPPKRTRKKAQAELPLSEGA